ncbi:MAG: hypothetical protein C0394_09980 [Syntrophus sp. (in: bacteria)]|nr:hypothetical protein [Syntrophus sp. (in: bacteria)]
MLRCAASFVVAVYVHIHLTPQDLRALPADFLRSRRKHLSCEATDMDEASETIRKNQEIAEKFARIEAELPLFSEPGELFEKLLLRLQKEFAVPFVWLSIVNRPDVGSFVQTLMASRILADRLNFIDETPFLELVSQGETPVLANKDLHPFYRLFPKNKKFFIKSIAVAPIMLDGQVIGSINYGDAENQRYEPGMDTSLLQHLTGEVSSCLTRLLKANPPLL